MSLRGPVVPIRVVQSWPTVLAAALIGAVVFTVTLGVFAWTSNDRPLPTKRPVGDDVLVDAGRDDDGRQRGLATLSSDDARASADDAGVVQDATVVGDVHAVTDAGSTPTAASPSSGSSIDRLAVAAAYLEGRRSRFWACAKDAMERDPGLSPKLTAAIRVDDTGAVVAATLIESPSPFFSACGRSVLDVEPIRERAPTDVEISLRFDPKSIP